MIKLNDSTLGYLNTLTKLKAGKVENTLNSLIRYNNIVMCRKEWLIQLLFDGYNELEVVKDVTYWSRKLDDYTKPKTEYHLYNKDDKSYHNITKTDYDFVSYLFENGLITESAIEQKLESENKETELQKLADTEQAKKEMEEKQKKKERENEYKEWLENQISTYPENEKYELAKEIFLSEIGEYSEQQLKKFLVLVENIHMLECRNKLKSWLHNSNITSKKVFYHVTGIKLDATYSKTLDILNSINTIDYKGIVSYKKRKESTEPDMVTFYKAINIPKFEWQESRGEKLVKYGLDMFITKTDKGYSITEGKTGCLMVSSSSTKKEMYENLANVVDGKLDKVKANIQNLIERNGISPLYRDQQIAI